MKSFIKRHRYTLILLLVFILLCILALKVKEILVPDEGKATYGERLKDIDKHPISDEVYEKIAEEFEKDDKVIKVDHRLQGKILNYYLTLEEKVTVKDGEAVDEELLKYYTIQVYLIKEDEALNNFPMIGLKDPLAEKISWTRERDITVSEDEE